MPDQSFARPYVTPPRRSPPRISEPDGAADMMQWQQVDKGRFALQHNGRLLEVLRNPDREDPRRYIAVIDHRPTGEPCWNVSQAKTRAMNVIGANGRATLPKAKRQPGSPSWAAKIKPSVDPFSLIDKAATDLGIDLKVLRKPEPAPEPAPEQPHVDKDQWLDSALGLDVKSADVGELSENSRSNAGEMPETAPELPVDTELEAAIEAERSMLEADRNALAHGELSTNLTNFQRTSDELPAPFSDPSVTLPALIEEPAVEGDTIIISVTGQLVTLNTVAVLAQIEAALELLNEVGELTCHISLPHGIKSIGKKQRSKSERS